MTIPSPRLVAAYIATWWCLCVCYFVIHVVEPVSEWAMAVMDE